MEIFKNTLGFVAAICIAVVFLTLFVKLVVWFSRFWPGKPIERMDELFRPDRLINVHLNGGKTLDSLRFIGVTKSGSKNEIPFQLARMLVCERPDGTRIFIRPDSVRLIEEVENQPDDTRADSVSPAQPGAGE